MIIKIFDLFFLCHLSFFLLKIKIKVNKNKRKFGINSNFIRSNIVGGFHISSLIGYYLLRQSSTVFPIRKLYRLSEALRKLRQNTICVPGKISLCGRISFISGINL
jgi:hypothetical protein